MKQEISHKLRTSDEEYAAVANLEATYLEWQYRELSLTPEFYSQKY